MKLLITGEGGQLGGELKRVLQAGASDLGPLPDDLLGAQVVGADLPEWDLSDAADVRRLFTAQRPDVVINCAAYTNVDACEADPDSAFRANALVARNLAVACEEARAKLLHVSTDYVFAGAGTRPYREWDICAPQSVYGTSKLLGETYVRDFCRRYFIVRTSWLYGRRGNNFVKTILKLAAEKGHLKVVDDQRGNPTNAADLAHHLLKLAASEQYGVYHCTGNGECSWYEFAKEFVELAGIDCEISPCTTQEFPRPAPRPAYSSLDNQALRCTVGDEMRDWRDAIGEYMKNYDQESGEFTL